MDTTDIAICMHNTIPITITINTMPMPETFKLSWALKTHFDRVSVCLSVLFTLSGESCSGIICV